MEDGDQAGSKGRREDWEKGLTEGVKKGEKRDKRLAEEWREWRQMRSREREEKILIAYFLRQYIIKRKRRRRGNMGALEEKMNELWQQGVYKVIFLHVQSNISS